MSRKEPVTTDTFGLMYASTLKSISVKNRKKQNSNNELIIKNWSSKCEAEAHKGNTSCVVSYPWYMPDGSFDEGYIICLFEKLGYTVMPRPNDNSKRIIHW